MSSYFMTDFQSNDANEGGVEGRVLQWKYASCRYNIEGAGGFYTFSKSEALSKGEKEELVEKVAHYEAPDTFPKRPDAEELKTFPVAFSSFRLSNGKSVLCRTQYVGRDYGGTRFGNFFAHALVLDKGTWQDPIRYYCSGSFARGLTYEEINLGRRPDALPEREAKSINADDSLMPGAREKLDLLQGRMLRAVQKILDAFILAVSKNANLVVYLDDKTIKSSALAFLAFFFAAIPKEISRKISFSTYVYDPSTERLLNDNRTCYSFVAFAPSSSRERRTKPGVMSVDLSDLDDETYSPKFSYSQYLSRDFNSFLRRFACPNFGTGRAEDAISGLQRERKEDVRFLHNLARLYETVVKDGSFPTDDRLTQTWRFLNDQPSDVADEVLTSLLQKDYRRSSTARETTREILAYCVRFNARLEEDGEDPEQTRRRVERVVAFWKRNIPRDANELKEWRRGLPEKFEKIFGTNNAASRAAGTLEFKKTFSASSYLREFVKRRTGDLAEELLILALGAFAAINEPNDVALADVKSIRATFERLRARLGDAWLNEFWSIYFPVWRAKITSSSSFDVLFQILGVYEKEDGFAFFVDALISDEIRDCWRRGIGWESPANAARSEASTRKNRFLDQLVEERDDDDFEAESTSAELTLVTAAAVEAARKAQRRRGARNARAVATSTFKTDSPGADALVCYFLEGRKFDVLKREEFFGTFSKGEFKRALGYFLQFSRSANWRDFKESAYGKDVAVPWLTIMTSVLLILALCGAGYGVWRCCFSQGALNPDEQSQRVERERTVEEKSEVEQ